MQRDSIVSIVFWFAGAALTAMAGCGGDRPDNHTTFQTEEPPIEPAISEEQASRVFGADTVRYFPRSYSPIEQEVCDWLRKHEMGLFHVKGRVGLWALTPEAHCRVLDQIGDHLSPDLRVVDVNGDGTLDLLITIDIGSGVYLEFSTILLDDGDTLAVYTFEGSIYQSRGHWWLGSPTRRTVLERETPSTRLSWQGANLKMEPKGAVDQNEGSTLFRRVTWQTNETHGGEMDPRPLP